MSSKARQKVDPQIRDMFDSEVDRPDHDLILTTVFRDEETIHSLLMALHRQQSLEPFTQASSFKLTDNVYPDAAISCADAVSRTGIAPEWVSQSPIRITQRQLEVPMLWFSDNGRSSRVIGFVDIGVQYVVIGWPIVHNRDGKFFWQKTEEPRHAIFEVKGAWPTVGNLIRQLNLYRVASASGLQGKQARMVIGPDASMNDVLCEHGFRLATFDQFLSKFELVSSNAKPKVATLTAGQF